MLTIREPISLKTQRPIQSIREDMAERMRANYELMRLPIRKEELLHITSEPPEIYFAEGDNLQIFNHIKQENQQELRLDVINNLLNRIMVSQTDNFTYQDTVYISSVLRRLGIRDEKNFMRQVFQLQNMQQETNRIIQEYEQHRDMLQLFFAQEKEEQETADGASAEALSEEQRYYIHNEIFKRLETGKIYQDMRSFSKGLYHESRQIFRNELSIGEQAAMVQQFHLHDLKERILQMDVPLVYFHQNQYEFLQENLEEVSETLEERISAAILLNLADWSYSLRQKQIAENSHHWYAVAGALFQTAENTWKRYERNLTENKHISAQMLQALEEVNTVKQQEGDTIQTIVQEFLTLHQDWQSSTEQTEFLQQQNRIQEEKLEEIHLDGGSYHLTQEEMELHFLQQEDEESEEEPTAITAEQLQKQLEVFQQKNIENYRKMTEIGRQQPQIKERKPDARKARQDALRALEQPNEVLTEFFAAEAKHPIEESQKQLGTQMYTLFSEETKEIYRQFLQQNQTEQTTFLQQIMAQPEENVLRQEVGAELQKQQRKRRTELRENAGETQFRRVDIVHKAEEQLLSEEMMETIRMEQQRVRKEEHTQESTLEQNKIHQTEIQNAISHTQVNRLENIDELVQQTVRKQLNHLSDQVYGKIEKKLVTERKRRGY